MLRQPGGDAAVEHGDAVVSHPAQQPPQPARKHPRVLIVGDHLHAVRDAEPSEGVDQRVGIRKGMASVRAVGRARQVVPQMGVRRAGHVGQLIFARAPVFVGQRETAVDDDPVRVGRVGGEFVCTDNSGERQLNPLHLIECSRSFHGHRGYGTAFVDGASRIYGLHSHDCGGRSAVGRSGRHAIST